MKRRRDYKVNYLGVDMKGEKDRRVLLVLKLQHVLIMTPVILSCRVAHRINQSTAVNIPSFFYKFVSVMR